MNDYKSDELYTFDEYCEVLGIGANLGRHLLKTGQVKGFFLGRSWRIPKSNIEAMILADIPKSLETAALVCKKAPTDFLCRGLS